MMLADQKGWLRCKLDVKWLATKLRGHVYVNSKAPVGEHFLLVIARMMDTLHEMPLVTVFESISKFLYCKFDIDISSAALSKTAKARYSQ